MPFCTQCAHALEDGTKFCPACGAAAAQNLASADITKTSAPAPPPPPTPSATSIHGRFEPGTKLGARYRIVALLGRGGMGEVYRADDLELGQSVALKFLPESVARNASDLARFRTEVRVARQIAHPNVCRVYDIGEADGHVFLSMEYIDGEDLASVLRRMGRPSPDKAIEIARQICLGLAAAHEAGMLHRDLKPANIMIDGRGRARITDFGLAGLADELSRDGGTAGTPAYMAPEQITAGQVSVRSDIYALGLVLYEVFTGKRVFNTANVQELRQLHESATLTTPSSLVRDLDPAVERVVMRCLEKDPEQRPPSAYAVLGGLPGGDPLAAALAAGEMPSPELVANAKDRGTMSSLVAVACAVVGIASLALWAGLIGRDLKQLTLPTEVLSVRATDVLAKTHAFATTPAHTAEGFDLNAKHLEHLRSDKAEKMQARGAAFFWRRWSPTALRSPNIHSEITGVNDPPLLAAGQATVLLDPAGRLVGLQAIPPDSIPAAPGGVPEWKTLFDAAGLDMATFAPAPLAQPAPATCDSAAAWTGTLPWASNEKITVQAGASRGRLVHFAIVHDWGSSLSPVNFQAPARDSAMDWLSFLIFTLLPFVASVYFARRNILLGRGDRKGATRIAVFVFIMNLLENAFPARLAENGLLSLISGWVDGRAFGHALIHAVSMWFAYLALEPYVRRLWPRILVSWTRMLSGRGRDPLVGRDVLIGGAAGVAIMTLIGVAQHLAAQQGWVKAPMLATGNMFVSASSLSLAACGFAYGGSICVLSALGTLVYVLLLRLLMRRTWPAMIVAIVTTVAVSAVSIAPDMGWPIAVLSASISTAGVVFLLMRVGLLAGTTAAFVSLIMSSGVATLDFSAWYAGCALLPMTLIAALLVFGAATALAGKPIFGDPLKEPAGR